MSNPLHEQLLGHLLGALDEPEQHEIAAQLRSDPGLQAELSRMRGRLAPLEACRYELPPPPGLAERTCRVVALRAESAAPTRRRPMSPEVAPPSSSGRFRWIDLAAAAAILAAGWLLLAPAIQNTRASAQLAGCQDNLRQIGAGLLAYSQQQGGFFPAIPTQGRLAASGIYAPILLREGFVGDSRRFVCPGSSLAGNKAFQVPSWEQLQTTSQEKLAELLRWMGGSYGYHLGYVRDGVYQGTKNLGRNYFALVSDSPGSDPSNLRQSPNHGGRGQNVLMEYGGVRFITSPRPFPQADDIFTNDLGLVAAGLRVDDSVIGSSAVRPLGALLAH
jgi:hypothetical protein